MVEAKTHTDGDRLVAVGVTAGDRARRIQQRQDAERVALFDRDGIDLGLDLDRALSDLVDVGEIARVARGPGRAGQQQGSEDPGVGPSPEPTPTTLQTRIQPCEPRLGEDQIAQQTRQKEALARPLEGERTLASQTETARKPAQNPVDRGAGLSAAGEIDTPHQRTNLETRGCEAILQKLLQDIAECIELPWKAEHKRTFSRLALLLHAGDQTLVETLDEGRALRGEGRECRGGLLLGLVGEGHAPDLLAPLLVQVREELHEAGHQIRLHEEHIDRDRNAEGLAQLLDALADRCRMGRPLRLALLHEVGETHCHQHPVDRPSRTVLLQQPEETLPGGAVHLLVAVLRGIASGGVDQDRLVGEPPVAVAGPPDALDSVLTETLGEREA